MFSNNLKLGTTKNGRVMISKIRNFEKACNLTFAKFVVCAISDKRYILRFHVISRWSRNRRMSNASFPFSAVDLLKTDGSPLPLVHELGNLSMYVSVLGRGGGGTMRRAVVRVLLLVVLLTQRETVRVVQSGLLAVLIFVLGITGTL